MQRARPESEKGGWGWWRRGAREASEARQHQRTFRPPCQAALEAACSLRACMQGQKRQGQAPTPASVGKGGKSSIFY